MKFFPFKSITSDEIDSLAMEMETAKDLWEQMKRYGPSELGESGLLTSGGFSGGIQQAGGTKGSKIRQAMAGLSSAYAQLLTMTKKPGTGAVSTSKQLLDRAADGTGEFAKPLKRKRTKAGAAEQADSADVVCLHADSPRSVFALKQTGVIDRFQLEC